MRYRAEREDRKSVSHGLYASSITNAASPPLLPATAASGKPSGRKKLDVDPPAALGYREMGRSWTTPPEVWGTWAGPCPHEGSLVSRTGRARALTLP